EHDGAVPPRRQPVRRERGPDDPRAGGVDVPRDGGGGGVVGAARATAGGQERGREAAVPARGRRGAVPQRHEVEDTMTGVPESAFAGEGQEAGPAEPPERRCARCGAVGTHYLTCPGLRLPTGYRLFDAPGSEAEHLTDRNYLSLYDYVTYKHRRTGALTREG